VTDFLPLPPSMVQRAREFRGPPAPTRAAATVVLMRPSPTNEHGTFEVYVLRRRTTMVFGGVYAFPGGGVDPSDRLPVSTPEVRADRARRLGLPPDEAAAVLAAAVREVHEETTVRLEEDRLLPWARWITPEFEPRRFDTWFFVAPLPPGEEAHDISGEADLTAWTSPAEALARYAAGEFRMLPPTVVVLRDLAAYTRVEDVVAAAAGRDAARPVMPRVELTADGGAHLHLP
jgi:8-oxo-dGTP pyrophosphatase MutT (NUDIX family)